jgi:hypothetical protein
MHSYILRTGHHMSRSLSAILDLYEQHQALSYPMVLVCSYYVLEVVCSISVTTIVISPMGLPSGLPYQEILQGKTRFPFLLSSFEHHTQL